MLDCKTCDTLDCSYCMENQIMQECQDDYFTAESIQLSETDHQEVCVPSDLMDTPF